MIRLTMLGLFVAALMVYSWRDWYKSLLGLILMIAVVEHPDMPKSMLGIQGLNPWNLALANLFVAWLVHRGREGLKWDMPKHIMWLLVIYMVVILIGVPRIFLGFDELAEIAQLKGEDPPGIMSVISEYVINGFKWVVPGLLLYDGARDEQRQKLALWCILGVYFLLAVQVIRWMPFAVLTSGDDLEERSLKILSNEVGFHRVNLSMMLSGAFWAVMASRAAASSRFWSWMLLGAAIVILLGQALTGGRAGYVTWAGVGFVLAVLKWRRYLIIGPVFAAVVLLLVPAAGDRLMQGFTEESIDVNQQIDSTVHAMDEEGPHWYTVTAGRIIAWPFVIDKILESPLIGYGRLSMQTTGLALRIWYDYGESFPHPHNAYLEWLLDNGFLGFIPIMVFYFLMFRYSLRLFKDKENKVYIAVGGACLSLILALFAASMGSQTFYPREGAVGMWCTMGLMLRIYMQSSTAQVKARTAARVRNNNYGAWKRPRQALPVR